MRRYALIGGACSGKTSVINEAKKRGINVIEEGAREIISRWGGFPSDRRGIERIEEEIFLIQLIREKALSKSGSKGDYALLDRGVFSSLVYSQHNLGYIPFEFNGAELVRKYDGVFVLDRLPFENDEVRYETDAEAEVIHQKLMGIYSDFGHELTRVKVLGDSKDGPGKRLDFIIGKIEGKKWHA